MKSSALGVVVVRLQVPELHAGHRYLLDAVTAIHDKVLVLIGVPETRLTPDDPLTYAMRRDMLRGQYPNVMVWSIDDHPSDYVWSEALDKVIGNYVRDHVTDPVLYGGRDSFLQHYHGRYRQFELPPQSEPASGTEIRKAVEVVDSPDFRRGMIYASKFRYPIVYQCVDAAIWRPGPGNRKGSDWLFGQKKRDDGKYRFIGGFVDPKDATLEQAVRREVIEETGIEPGNISYISSQQVLGDFRYPPEGVDRLMTAFFMVQSTFGAGIAKDDIDFCRWMTLDEAEGLIVPEHRTLFETLRAYLRGMYGV